LSGGEQQRVAIARTLVLEPNLLLLDEPLSALDPQIQLEIRDELKRIHREFGVTIVHVTHNQEEAMVLADRIAIMDHGKIIQVGGSEEIFRKPSSEFIAKFVGAENIFKGKAEKQGVITKINLGPIKISVSTDLVGDVHVTIRPEDIILSKTKIESSARNVFSGKITSINYSQLKVKISSEIRGSSVNLHGNVYYFGNIGSYLKVTNAVEEIIVCEVVSIFDSDIHQEKLSFDIESNRELLLKPIGTINKENEFALGVGVFPSLYSDVSIVTFQDMKLILRTNFPESEQADENKIHQSFSLGVSKNLINYPIYP